MDALRRVLDYMRENELKHFEESGSPDDHIYSDVQILERWLDGD